MNNKSYRILDGKARWVIIDENRNIINRNPSKDELRSLIIAEKPRQKIISYGTYNKTNTCDCGCGKELIPGITYPRAEYINGI